MPFLGSKYTPKLLLRPGLCPGPRWGSLQRSPRPPSCIKGGLLLRGGEGKGERGREEEGGEERGGGSCAPPPFSNSWIRPCVIVIHVIVL